MQIGWLKIDKESNKAISRKQNVRNEAELERAEKQKTVSMCIFYEWSKRERT